MAVREGFELSQEMKNWAIKNIKNIQTIYPINTKFKLTNFNNKYFNK